MEESEKALREILYQTFKSDPGNRVLAYLYHTCGYGEPNIINKPDGSINAEAMMYNEGRRSVYMELRNFIDPEILKKVEIDFVEKQKKASRRKNKELNKPTKK